MPTQASQTELDRVARHVMATAGAKRETVTYRVKASLADTGTPHTLTALIDEYRGMALANEAILPTDRRARVRVAQVTWAPGDYDELTRADGSIWRVQSSTGGVGHSFYVLQLRQVA